MSRPRALDDTKQREVCALVTTGCSLQTAAKYVGCNVVTIRREAARNPNFYERLRQAEIACQVSPLQAMRRAADKHWRAAAWLLERTDPQQFGRRNPRDFKPEDVIEFFDYIQVIVANTIKDPETRDKVAEALSRASRQAHRDFAAQEKPRRDRRRQPEPIPHLPPPDEPDAVDNDFDKT